MVLSAAGPLLLRLVLQRLGRTGGLIAEGVLCMLLARVIALILGGAPRRLRRLARVLLALEGVADSVAVLMGWWIWVWPLVRRQGAAREGGGRARACGSHRAVWAVFALHTVRLGIYVRPDHGLRAEGADQPRILARGDTSQERTG